MAPGRAQTIGIIGAGKLGRTLATLSNAAGYSVMVHGSGPLARTSRILETFVPTAEAVSLTEVVRADIVVLAIALSDAESLDPALFDGVIVADPMNYWEETDGLRPDFDDPGLPTSMRVQQWLSGARVVKVFNHVAYKDLAGGARTKLDRHRWGIVVAADDAAAAQSVAAWVDAVGFDPVAGGMLLDTYVLQPGQPLFGVTETSSQLAQRLMTI